MRAIFLGLLVLTAACTPPHASQTPHTSRAGDLESKTVALLAPGEDGARAYCSGVWVGEHEIVTANHCVADLAEGEVVAFATRGDVSAENNDDVQTVRVGTLKARDEDHDLALIRVKLPPLHGVAAVAEPHAGELAQTMGHPLGLWWSYSAGNVAAIRHMEINDMDAWWVQSTAPMSPGNSGGALFNADGDIIGIAHALVPARFGENINLYIHPLYVAEFLKGATS